MTDSVRALDGRNSLRVVDTMASMDGVMQAARRAGRRPRRRVEFGDWVAPSQTPTPCSARRLGKLIREPFDLLFARRIYEILAAYWKTESRILTRRLVL